MDEDEGTLPHAQGAVKARKRPIWVRNQLIINAYVMSTLGSGGAVHAAPARTFSDGAYKDRAGANAMDVPFSLAQISRQEK